MSEEWSRDQRRGRARGSRLRLAALCIGMLGALLEPARAQDAAAEPIVQEHRLGPVRLTLEADRHSMPIDGDLHLTLLVEAPTLSVVGFPEAAARLGPFVVASHSALGPTTEAEGRELWRHDLILEAEGVGDLTVPALTVTIRDDGAAAADLRQITTDPLAVTITSVLPPDADLAQPRDIAPPVQLPRASAGWLPWLLAAVVLAFATLALVFWRRRRTRPPAALEPRPAHLLALAELERLQAMAGRAEDLYPGLADLLRRYLVARFGLQASARTTEELLAAARAEGPLAGLRSLIGPVLATCDLVKFARERPPSSAAATCLDQARAFIEQTADEQVVVTALAAPPA